MSVFAAGVIAASGGGSSPYHASAVNFDGSTSLACASLTATDNNKVSYSLWVMFTAGVGSFYPLWTCDGAATYRSFAGLACDGDAGATAWTETLLDATFDVRNVEPGPTPPFPLTAGVWYNFIYASDSGSAVEGDRKAKLYINDVDVTILVTNNQTAAVFDGLPLQIGTDTFDDLIGSASDWRIDIGVSYLDEAGDIPEATRRLFIDADGKPVDPTVATAELGAPCVLFSGDADTFATNQGTGGAFVTTGALTNASSSPSD